MSSPFLVSFESLVENYGEKGESDLNGVENNRLRACGVARVTVENSGEP
jgi:hypothetical protein